MTTIRDVTRLASVSSITVSRVMSGTTPVSPETRLRVEAAIRELNYVPNLNAQSLKGRQTRTIGLVVGDITNPFFTQVARGFEDVAHAAGYSLILCNSDDTTHKEQITSKCCAASA